MYQCMGGEVVMLMRELREDVPVYEWGSCHVNQGVERGCTSVQGGKLKYFVGLYMGC